MAAKFDTLKNQRKERLNEFEIEKTLLREVAYIRCKIDGVIYQMHMIDR